MELGSARHARQWFGGGTPSKAKPEFWTEGMIPWVSPKDMKRPVIDCTEDNITEAAIASSAAKMVPSGSVLCVVRSGILAHTFPVAISTVPVTINQDMRALHPRKGVLPDFLAHYLRFAQASILARCSKHGTTVASIETGRLDNYPVPICREAKQRETVVSLSALLNEMADGKTALTQARADLEVYRRSLLKAAVTGELTADWRAANPPQESGAALLARILADRRTRWQADPRNRGKRYHEPTALDFIRPPSPSRGLGMGEP